MENHRRCAADWSMSIRAGKTYAISVALLFLLAVSNSIAQPPPELWIEPQDTTAALLDPDAYAWRLFVALNWPANTTERTADLSKRFGTDGPVVWETWRNVLFSAPDSIFRLDGSDPGPWLDGGTPAVARTQRHFEPIPRQLDVLFAIQRQIKRNSPLAAPAFDAAAALGQGSEVRMNRSAYGFVRDNELYNTRGQAAQVRAGNENLGFRPTQKK